MNKYRYLIIILGLLTAVGCTKLQEDPKGIMAPEGFFKTASDVEAAVYGAYAQWCNVAMEKSFLLMLMLRGDMVDIGDLNTNGDRISINNFQLDSYNSLVNDGWTHLYMCVSAANSAIKGAREIAGDMEEKNKLEAQARFIRAYSYYNLVRCFGAVPYLKLPIETTAALDTLGRMPVSNVYDEIIADLKFAKDNLPQRNTPSGVRNIATEGTAATVLADVYLTLKRYKEAADEARFVINHADQFDYHLEKDYQDLFNGNIEMQYALTEPILTIDLKPGVGEGGYNPSDGLVNLTRVRDLAPRSLSVAVPSLKAYTSWDQRDYRRKVSFEDTVEMNGKRTALVDANVRVPRPHIAKYFRYQGPLAGDDRESNHHYCLYRYADVLLIAAEAIAESEGPTQEAIGYVNQIRARARFNGKINTAYPADVNPAIGKTDFIQVIREERRLEFAFEFNRWYDIKRWDIIKETFTGPDSREPHEVNANDYLFPIPQREIDITGFEQNGGY